MSIQIKHGDCREVLKSLPDESVDCVITSPPYWGLRDYGVIGQIGLEPTLTEYIDNLLQVFGEVKRVLKDDGTLWVNLGDSYAGSGKGGNPEGSPHQKQKTNAGSLTVKDKRMARGSGRWGGGNNTIDFLPAKNLIGIPWRVAFALQDSGWFLRQDIIWSKPNPMPESVQDRCTKSHEYIFLLSKSPRYYFDNEAIKESAIYFGLTGQDASGFKDATNYQGKHAKGNAKSFRGDGSYTNNRSFENSNPAERQTHGNLPNETGMRNKRSVWTIATYPYAGAHFATFPPSLVEPCILAGCPRAGVVLDPFGGAGTTALVADRLQRNAILIELNSDYSATARNRINDDAPMFSTVSA